jgi:transposase
VPISLSTLADQVGGCTAVLMPLFKRLEAYVLSAELSIGVQIWL